MFVELTTEVVEGYVRVLGSILAWASGVHAQFPGMEASLPVHFTAVAILSAISSTDL